MSLQLRLRDTWLPRLFSRFLAASFRWNVPSSCREDKKESLVQPTDPPTVNTVTEQHTFTVKISTRPRVTMLRKRIIASSS